MSRKRLNIFLEPDHAKRLAETAALKGISQSTIVAAALASALSPDSADQREAAISHRLDRLSRQFNKLEQDHNIAIETLALFIRYFLTVSPVVPDPQREAAWAQGRARFAQFVQQLARQLQRGKSLVRDLHEEIFPDEDDFFVADAGQADDGQGVKA
jgi:hypothetical protein